MNVYEESGKLLSIIAFVVVITVLAVFIFLSISKYKVLPNGKLQYSQVHYEVKNILSIKTKDTSDKAYLYGIYKQDRYNKIIVHCFHIFKKFKETTMCVKGELKNN